MLYYAAKVVLSALVIVAVSEIAKRHSTLAALLASLPLTSLLAFVWFYLEGASGAQVASLSRNVFWLVLPSLVLFLVLPFLLERGLGFWMALGGSVVATVASYGLMLALLARLGVRVDG